MIPWAPFSSVHDADPEARRTFLDTTVAINLARIEAVLFTFPFMAFLNLFPIDEPPRWKEMMPGLDPHRLMTVECLVCGAVWLGIAWARRWARSMAGKRAAMYGYVVFGLLHMDFWFFLSYSPAAEYWVCAFGLAMMILLAPRAAAGLVVGNFLFLLAWLALLHPPGHSFVPAAIAMTSATAFSLPLGWYLFTRRWESFLREQLIVRQNRDLVRAHAELDEMIAITAHDLGSPLHGLRDILHMGATLPHLSREQSALIFSQAVQSCDDLLGLAGRLLEVHTAEYGAEPSRPPHTGDIRLPFLAAIDRARVLRGTRKIDIALTLPESEETLQVDVTALNQVLDNLLSNAVRHSPDGGRIEVTLAASPRGWRGEVRDEGDGVPEAEREWLFRKFHRGSHAGKGKPGTGLGLFIVHKRMERMGGRVSYHPAPGRGSVFRIELG